MQPAERLMLRVAEVCEKMALPYFVTGSVASMAWGEPRSTLDVDIVVELPSWKAREFCSHFPQPEFYVNEESAIAAAQGPGMFNIIQASEGVKADIIVFAGRPFDESRLGRARRLNLSESESAMFSSPEDIILSKLQFFREGGSDKHLRDITSMIRVSGPEIDLAYIEQWALRLGVVDQWKLIKQRLGMP